MPIRAELRPLYPADWPELSRRVRFERAGGECERCGRPHGVILKVLPDGRWFDPRGGTWRDRRGRAARWPDLEELARQRTTRVVLAAAHLDHDPTNNRLRNLRCLCQRCHLLHDRVRHLAERWITVRLRYAIGDLFLGRYLHGPSGAVLLAEILASIAKRLARERAVKPRRNGSDTWAGAQLVLGVAEGVLTDRQVHRRRAPIGCAAAFRARDAGPCLVH